MTKTILYSRA